MGKSKSGESLWKCVLFLPSSHALGVQDLLSNRRRGGRAKAILAARPPWGHGLKYLSAGKSTKASQMVAARCMGRWVMMAPLGIWKSSGTRSRLHLRWLVGDVK